MFTKLVREITVAARMGGGDPDANARLRLAVDKALAASMPKDNIERAIRRGCGEAGGDAYEEVRYEGYGPGGVAIMIDCMTDNRTRTVADVRHALSKHGGNLGSDGSVSYLFSKAGVIGFESGSDAALEEKILEAALEAGADDVLSSDGWTEVVTAPDAFGAVRQALAGAGLEPAQADVTLRPATTVEVSEEHAQSLMKLLERLEELDDVQAVFCNAEFPDGLLDAA